MQLGFVIDHSRCIGCHACTVACKSENEVPLGDFRTWVKYTEEGAFPEVKRSFAVLRCNQCTDAPCVTICPVTALDKRPDGIVDIDPKACIGCKACMHGCPYDALYLNEETGMAEKCHFCAHRTEMGLAPACAIVCPTEAIVPGDFDDPNSQVSRMKTEFGLTARKTEAGTGPNVFYREATPAGLDPGLTNLAGGSIWSQNPTGPRVDAQVYEALERKAEARTVYDVPRKELWGGKITGYMWFKSLSAGVFPAALLAMGTDMGLLAPLLALLTLAVTGLLLVLDLKRPDRFYYILLRPNWNSWLARGTFVIVAYSALLVAWLGGQLVGLVPESGLAAPLASLTAVLGLTTAAYTGWLFAQAKGRVLWMKRGLWLHLGVQAMLAGSALLLVAAPLVGTSAEGIENLGWVLLGSLGAHLALTLAEERLAPNGREEEYSRAVRLLTHGPWASRHWGLGVVLGIVLPVGLLLVGGSTLVPALAGLLALAGLWFAEDAYVRAAQALPIS